MKTFLKTLVLTSLILLTGVLVYLRYDSYDDIKLKEYNIKISHSDSLKFITADGIEEWLFSDSCSSAIGTPMSEISTKQIEEYLNNMAFVSKANVTKTILGAISINIEQAEPIFKVYTSNGESIYIDKNRVVHAPNSSFTKDLPIVTCDTLLFEQITKYDNNIKKSDKNYYFLEKLFNFVEYVGSDKFWDSQIARINITANGVVELIPRVGDQEITMCYITDIEKYKDYLYKLYKFYDKQLPKSGWGTYSSIDLKFDNMIVCKGVKK